MSDKIAIIGYSGHAFVVADAAILCGMPLKYYCERLPSPRNPFGFTYLGNEWAEDFTGWEDQMGFILGIGDNLRRVETAGRVLAKGGLIHNVVHPHSSVSTYFQLGTGNFISRNVSINAFTKIGDFCILNTGCILEHECELGNGVHLAPGAVLAGNVKIGDLSFIGAGSVLKQGIHIGSNVIIGAGAVVIRDVPDNAIVAGNPGKPLSKKNN